MSVQCPTHPLTCQHRQHPRRRHCTSHTRRNMAWAWPLASARHRHRQSAGATQIAYANRHRQAEVRVRPLRCPPVVRVTLSRGERHDVSLPMSPFLTDYEYSGERTMLCYQSPHRRKSLCSDSYQCHCQSCRSPDPCLPFPKQPRDDSSSHPRPFLPGLSFLISAQSQPYGESSKSRSLCNFRLTE
jgi:hypothetical protein